MWIPLLLLTSVSGCGPKAVVQQEKEGEYRLQPFGFNTANMFLYRPELVHEQEAVVKLLKGSGDVLRFPGGTTANFYHPEAPGYGYRTEDVELLNPSKMQDHIAQVAKAEGKLLRKHAIEDNFITAFAELAVKTDQKVLYVANLLSGTLEETLLALEVLHARGVLLQGIELGNEYYLKAYAKAYPTVKDYMEEAKAYAVVIHEKYPDVPISVVAAPVEAMKSVSDRDRAWNEGLKGYDFYDALSIHFYPHAERTSREVVLPCSFDEAIIMGMEQPQKALLSYEELFPEKQFWITEWNVAGAPKWCNNSTVHAFFIALMQDALSANSQVSCSIYHTLISKASEGFNAYRPDQNAGFSPQPNVRSLDLLLRLREHLGASEGSYSREVGSINESCFYLSYADAEGVKAVMLFNRGMERVDFAGQFDAAKEHIVLNDEILESVLELRSKTSGTAVAAESISLLLY